MPLYIPWLTETIKKRGVRYLLHHYLGQFFEEKLTLEQLSIDIYEGKGSIRNLALDVDGLNDELDFIPFRFLEGCLIGQISVEVPWSSLATDACKVELDGAKFYCRLKTSADAAKPHCTESSLLSRSLMTSSMQMAEEIVTTEDDDMSEGSIYHHHNHHQSSSNTKEPSTLNSKRKDANQMFEGLEMFAQLIDSVLRRTNLIARNTLFQIKPYGGNQDEQHETDSSTTNRPTRVSSSRSSGDEFSEPLAKSDTDEDEGACQGGTKGANHSESTVEFFIKFFRCEEMVDQTRADKDPSATPGRRSEDENVDGANKSLSAIPETITKLLTLEDVEMRIDGTPVSNLVGKHTITIKFNGQKSEISVFSGSPLLAVIGHKQLKTFFKVFDGAKEHDMDSSFMLDKDQKLMSPEDYAKIENQLLESASLRNIHANDLRATSGSFGGIGGNSMISNSKSPYYATNHQAGSGTGGARRWVESGDIYSDMNHHQTGDSAEFGYHSPNSSTLGPLSDMKQSSDTTEPTLNHIEAFSCELKLPGIWLCVLRDGETLPPLIKPYADSINSFQSVNKYLDGHIKVPHIRFLALKVALDITAAGTNIFLGDLDISEHLEDTARMSPVLKLLNNDQSHIPMNSSRYKASITNGNNITLDLLTKTRIMFDPTIIDRIIYDYKLIELDGETSSDATSSSSRSKLTRRSSQAPTNYKQQRGSHADLHLTIRGEQFKFELLCPIPDLTPEAQAKRTQLRPQSFLFDFKDVNMSWQSDKFEMSSSELVAYVKTQPKQSDNEAVKFIESTGKGNDKIVLILEPSPSNLDNDFTNDIERALNESSMYESIYVSQTTESKIPTEPFQTKRKVVRASFQSQQTSNKPNSARISECDHEKILTPGDRQHLLDYLNQTVMSTKLSLDLHLPICEVEFEDKEQLDLIYNRFGNDFVFWQPRAFTKATRQGKHKKTSSKGILDGKSRRSVDELLDFRPINQMANDEQEDADQDRSSDSDNEDEGSQASFHSVSHNDNDEATSATDRFENEVTCKIIVDELFVKFNHQSCAAALKQEISADNFLMGVVIDVNRKPNTMLSLVADNLQLSTDLDTVLEGNSFGSKNTIFSLTAEIKRPTKALKDIKLAIQLKNGLFNDFRSETYTRFWQSINVTDEPILGYVAPKIVTELHIDILSTGLLLVRDGARPALLSIDELYLTSMVMEQTSQVMIRLIADEVSLYMKRDRQGSEIMKNYICLIDSGLIDLDVKFGGEGCLEFGVINNVITVRVCQDSLSALCKLFNVLIRQSGSSHNNQDNISDKIAQDKQHLTNTIRSTPSPPLNDTTGSGHEKRESRLSGGGAKAQTPNEEKSPYLERDSSSCRDREMNLLVDAMNDYILSSNASRNINTKQNDSGETDRYATALDDDEASDYGDDDGHDNSDNKDKSDEEVSEVSGSRDEEDGGGSEQSDEDDNGGEKNDGDYDSDASPAFQRTTTSTSNESRRQNNNSKTAKQRYSSASILDESNPKLGDLICPPLLPMTGERHQPSHSTMANSSGNSANFNTSMLSASSETFPRTMDESGFFVIGEDDVGAGIIDKQRQHEPVVRKLIDGPINIIENHFKMTRPRTIPEMLATSLERYVLEEMTLVVNLYGGRDFDDEDPDSANDDASSSPAPNAAATGTGPTTAATDQALESTNESLDTISAENQSIRSRAGSIAGTRRQLSTDASSSLKRLGTGGKLGGKRKHLSEGSGSGRLDFGISKTVEQRVRFGEGAVNLWESLDLMSSPDFLGARSGPNQPALSLDTKQAGGTWRQNDVRIQLTLSKVKLLYELADGTSGKSSPSLATAKSSSSSPLVLGGSGGGADEDSNLTPPISWRFMLFIQDIEVKDRIAASDINKMLYEYCNESMPKRSTQMLTIKNTATINLSDGCEECDLRVSLKPLRLNVDQDTLLFLIEFFTTFCKSLTKQQSIYTASSGIGQVATTTTTTTGRSSGNAMAQAAVAANLSKQVGDNSAASKTTITTASSSSAKSSGGGGGNRQRTGEAEEVVTRNEAHAMDDGENSISSSKSVRSASSSQVADGASSVGDGTLRSRRRDDSTSSLSSTSSSLSSSNNSSGTTTATSSLSASATTRHARGGSRVVYVDDGDDGDDDEDEDDVVAAAAGKAANIRNARKSRTTSASSTSTATTTTTTTTNTGGGAGSGELPTHCHIDILSGSANHQPIYIKSFTFSPDVPIRIDYHAKHLDFEQGALAGILMGLAHLDHSELILRRVQAKHGMRGLDRVLVFAINSWLSDIKRNQLPSLLGGFGPMHSVIQLFQGMRDLIWMPIDHYRKDGRLVRGLQRGASSFSSSTAMAAINLVNRFISIIQCTAQIAHDIVTPPSMSSGRSSHHRNHHHHHQRRRPRPLKVSSSGTGQSSSAGGDLATGSRRNRHHSIGINQQNHQQHYHHHHHIDSSSASASLCAANNGGLNQPRNFCEGVAVGFTIIKEGFNDTARNVTVGMQAEDMRSAVGELVRQIPSTLLNPIISATEGAQSVLVGIRNQIAPDARRDDQEKWKGRVRGK